MKDLQSSPKILIVDDTLSDQKSVAAFLTRNFVNGCDIHTVDKYSAAKKKIRNEKFDIITLDGNMGLECGYNLIPDIQRFQTTRCIIIMITGTQSCIDRGLLRGAHFGFIKYDIQRDVKLNEAFELVPLRQAESA